MKEKEANKLWNRLFGESDEAVLKTLTNEEFDTLVDILENTNTPIEWEADKAGKTVHLWKPTNFVLTAKEYAPLILLLAMSTSKTGRKLLHEVRRKNKNSSKNKSGTQ